MLDDLNVIKQRDPQDALGHAFLQAKQLAHDFGIAASADFGDKPIFNVVFAGMGGSALAAERAKSWPELKEPFVLCREYSLPSFVDEDTLVICSSYSGNTEETLAALDEAVAKKARIAIIAHDGVLSQKAKELGCVYAAVPECTVPRMGVLYDLRALTEILAAAKLIPASAVADLAALAEPLERAAKDWLPDVPQASNYAKQLAHEMVGKTPIIYSGPKMFVAAYEWKISVNENAKNTAWCNQYSEVDHNEFMGWTSHPIEKPFAIIDLVSRFEHEHIQKRFALTDRMLSGMRPHAVTVEAKGDSMVEHMLYLGLLGVFASVYMGILNGVNPTEVDLAEKFKKELASS